VHDITPTPGRVIVVLTPQPEATEEAWMNRMGRAKGVAVGGALLLAGAGIGAAVAVMGSASAATDAASSAVSRATDHFDPSKSVNPEEDLLTGTKLDKVTAAAEAAYPNATIQRVETDSEGVYEAHIVTAGGQELIVQVSADFTVTGTQSFGGHGGPTDGDDVQ
jgi:hypothetical protein